MRESSAESTEDLTERHDYGSLDFPSGAPVRSASATTKPQIVGAYISEGCWSTTIDEAIRQLGTLQTLGVNTVIDYNLLLPEDTAGVPKDPSTFASNSGWRRYMNAAAAANIKIAYPLKGYLTGLKPDLSTSDPNYQAVRDANQAKLDKLKRVVELLRKESAIGYWYVHDEKLPSMTIPDANRLPADYFSKNYVISINQMSTLYNTIHTADSTLNGGLNRPQMQVWINLPTWDQFNTKYKAKLYGTPPNWSTTQPLYDAMMTRLVQTCADVAMVDSYPFGNAGATGFPLDYYPNLSLTRAKSLLKSGQPLVFVFQSFSWAVQTDPPPAGSGVAGYDWLYPDKAEMTLMLQPAKNLGCNGAIAYNWYNLDNPPPARDKPGREACLTDLKAIFNTMKTNWP